MSKVLIVDDNKVIRLMLSEMLKKIDDIEIAGESETAIEAKSFLSKQEVDILLLDVEMPGMTSLELLKVLFQKPATILITAKTAYAIEDFELNVIDYIVKPVSLARVILAIEKQKIAGHEKYTGKRNKPDQIFLATGIKVILSDVNDKVIQQLMASQSIIALSMKEYGSGVFLLKMDDGLVQKIIK